MGILSGPVSPRTITMKFNYFLFGKDFSSYTYYTYIRNKKIEDEGHSIVHGITEAARKVIALHRKRDLKSSLGIEIYLVSLNSKLPNLF